MNLYVVRNKDGKYFRPRGYGGYGDHWNTELSQAKFYPKIGQAKGRVTYFAKHFPQFGVCEILEFTLDPTQAKVMNMEDNTTKVLEKARQAKFELEKKRNEREMQRLQAERDAIDSRLKFYRQRQ